MMTANSAPVRTARPPPRLPAPAIKDHCHMARADPSIRLPEALAVAQPPSTATGLRAHGLPEVAGLVATSAGQDGSVGKARARAVGFFLAGGISTPVDQPSITLDNHATTRNYLRITQIGEGGQPARSQKAPVTSPSVPALRRLRFPVGVLTLGVL